MTTYKTLSVVRMTGSAVTRTMLVCAQNHVHSAACYQSVQDAPSERVGVRVEYGGAEHYHEIESTDPVEIEQQLADLALHAEAQAARVAPAPIVLPSMGKVTTAKARPAPKVEAFLGDLAPVGDAAPVGPTPGDPGLEVPVKITRRSRK